MQIIIAFCDQLIRRASILEHGNGNCKPQTSIQYQSLWFSLWPNDPPSFNPGTLEHGNGNCKPQASIQYQSLWIFLWPIDPPSFNPGAWQWELQTAGCNSYKVYDSFCDQLIRRASILEHGNGNCKPQAVIQYQSLWFFLWPIDPPSFNPGAWRWQLQTAGCNSVSNSMIYRFARKQFPITCSDLAFSSEEL